jgi:hypothetical protein
VEALAFRLEKRQSDRHREEKAFPLLTHLHGAAWIAAENALNLLIT